MSGVIVPARPVGLLMDIAPPAAKAVGDIQARPAAVEAERPQPQVEEQSINRSEPESHSEPHPRYRTAAVAAMVAGFVVVVAQMSFSIAFAGRVLPGVTVADVPLGGLTQSEAKASLQQHVQNFRLTLTAGGITYPLNPGQAGVSYDLTATADQAVSAGRSHPVAWLASLARGRAGSLDYSYRVDTTAEQVFAQQLTDATSKLPIDAAVVIQNGTPVVQPDQNGEGLRPSKIEQAITAAVATVNEKPQKLQFSTLIARIRSADTASAITQAKQLLATPVTITYQSKNFQPTAAQIGQWIVFDKSPPDQQPGLAPKVDPAAVKSYLASIAPQINVSPVIQKVNVQNGVSQQYQAGQNGTSLDENSLAASIVTAVTNKQALSITAPTVTVPFQTQYNNSVPLPFDKYIEVNLSQQHLWVYQDHKVIYDSPVTSGATGAGFPTVTGQFAVYAKETNRHLVGYQYGPRYNYDVFVQYWMPFYQGFGLHDASWRSSFGGSDYYYGGSHGCINLPLATAAFLYGWVDVGTPVWVHN